MSRVSEGARVGKDQVLWEPDGLTPGLYQLTGLSQDSELHTVESNAIGSMQT